MKIFLTGATGFVGAHTALELLSAGHELRLLVRDVDLARRYFAEKGHELDDFVVADMCEGETIKVALTGCDAVFHAAAMVSLDPLQARKVYETNVASISAVMESAIEQGIKNIVWVSSLSVFFRPGAKTIDENSPLYEARDAYTRSKTDCEKLVRGLQARGAPVQITYPSGIIGPDDPRLSESNRALSGLLSFVPRTSTGLQHVDVRDLAKLHRYMLEYPPEADFERARYLFAGHYLSWDELHGALEELTGNQIAHPRLPGSVLRLIGRIADLLQRIRPFETHFSAEAMRIATQYPVADSSRALAHANLSFRPVVETFADAIRWQVEAGHLNAKNAGRLKE